MTREEKAVYYKHNGFNCCQSVIKAMIDLSNSDKEILTNAASGFAVGMNYATLLYCTTHSIIRQVKRAALSLGFPPFLLFYINFTL